MIGVVQMAELDGALLRPAQTALTRWTTNATLARAIAAVGEESTECCTGYLLVRWILVLA